MSVHTMKQLRQYSSTLPPEKKTPPKRQLRGEEQLCVPQPPSLSRPKNTTTKKDNYVCYRQQSFQSKKSKTRKKATKQGNYVCHRHKQSLSRPSFSLSRKIRVHLQSLQTSLWESNHCPNHFWQQKGDSKGWLGFNVQVTDLNFCC